MTSHQLRIAIVEDEDLFRDLLGLALERHERFLVVGSFSNAPEALARIPNLEPDLVMLDIDLGGSMNGVELGMALQKHIPNLGVVLLSNHQDLEFVAGLGAEVQRWSYLLKKSANVCGSVSQQTLSTRTAHFSSLWRGRAIQPAWVSLRNSFQSFKS